MDFNEIENNIYGQDDEISTEKETKSSSKKWKKIILSILISIIIICIFKVAWHYFAIWIDSLICYDGITF